MIAFTLVVVTAAASVKFIFWAIFARILAVAPGGRGSNIANGDI